MKRWQIPGLLALLLVAACAIPGRAYRVTPQVSGTIHALEPFGAEPRIWFRVRHWDSPALAAEREVAVAKDGSFEIEPIDLTVAGHEYSKRYRAIVHVRGQGLDRVIWRAEFSRGQLTSPLRLDCDAARPARHGQPCQVVDATQQAWLVQQGERSFERRCASCHGVAGRGDGPAAPALATRPPNLRQIAARNGGQFDRIAVLERIEGRSLPPSHGSMTMPIWGERLARENELYPNPDEVSAVTLDELVTYLESVQEPAP